LANAGLTVSSGATQTQALTASSLTISSGGSTQLGNGTFTCNAPITLNAAYAANPTDKLQLGCVITETNALVVKTLSTTQYVNGTAKDVLSLQIGIGTWIVSASYTPVIASTPGSVSNQQLILNTTTTSSTGFRAQASETIVVSTPSLLPWFSVSGIFTSVLSSTTVYLTYVIGLSGGNVQVGTPGTNYTFMATRIA